MIITKLTKASIKSFFTKKKITTNFEPAINSIQTSDNFFYKKFIYEGLDGLLYLQKELLSNGISEETSIKLQKLFKAMKDCPLDKELELIYKETQIRIAIELAKQGIFI